VRQVFSHCSKAFLRSQLWKPETWPAPETVASPTRITGELAREKRLRESEMRAEVEQEYRAELY
jgi:hypothetical protein